MNPIQALRMRRPVAIGGGDPFWSSVVFLSGFEGVDGSTSFTDESSAAHAITALSAAQVDTAQFKFGSSSLLLDGTNDAISMANSADWQFGSGAFTIEAWIRYNSVTASTIFLGHTNSSGKGWNFYRDNGSLQFTASSGVIGLSSAWTPSAGGWYHIAIDRDGSGVARLYRDGTMLVKQTGATGSIDDPSIGLYLSRIAYVDTWNFNGWMDEVRITKGVARYASDSGFTVPAAALPRS